MYMHLTSKDLEAVRILLDLYHENSNSSSSIAVLEYGFRSAMSAV